MGQRLEEQPPAKTRYLTMRIILLSWMMLFPVSAFGATDCQIIEHPDHFEVFCVGDFISEPAAATTAATSQQPDMTSQDAPQLHKSTESGSIDIPDRKDAASSTRTQGTRRMQTSTMEAARAMRLKIMQEQQQKESNTRAPDNAKGHEQ
jgi:hypothetical protein